MEKQTVPTPPSPQQPAIPQKPKSPFLLIGLAVLVLILLASTGFLALQNYQLRKEVSQLQSSPSPTPALDPTANWRTYANTAYGYSIKYPASFTTELVAGDAGHKEADSTARSLFIYQPGAQEPYLERFVSLEMFQAKPTYDQGLTTEATIDNRTATKVAIPDAKFDIYSAQVGNKGFIEIYVSNDPAKKEIANQILSTFKFLETPSPTP